MSESRPLKPRKRNKWPRKLKPRKRPRRRQQRKKNSRSFPRTTKKFSRSTANGSRTKNTEWFGFPIPTKKKNGRPTARENGTITAMMIISGAHSNDLATSPTITAAGNSTHYGVGTGFPDTSGDRPGSTGIGMAVMLTGHQCGMTTSIITGITTDTMVGPIPESGQSSTKTS